MIDLVYVIPAFTLLVSLGWVLDRAFAWRFDESGFVRWPFRFFAGSAAASLMLVHPALSAVALAVLIAVRLARAPAAVQPVRAFEVPDRFVVGALAVLAAISLARPASPIYWDEFIWLWKSRIAQGSWSALRTASLDPHGGVFPRGYPLLWSSLVAWLVAPFERAPLTTAATTITMTAVAAWLGLVREASRARGDGSRVAVIIAACALSITPIALVHLRSAYIDLVVGLLAASVALALNGGANDTVRAVPLAAPVALGLVLVGFKDEGFAHIVAVTVAAVLSTLPDRARNAWRPAVVFACAAVPFAAWRWLLARAGITDVEHHIGSCAVSSTPSLAIALARHALRIDAWGILWPVAIGGAVAALLRPETRRSRVGGLALTAAMQFCVLFGGIVCGPESTREFAFDGSLLNRAMLQIAPTVIAMLALLFSE